MSREDVKNFRIRIKDMKRRLRGMCKALFPRYVLEHFPIKVTNGDSLGGHTGKTLNEVCKIMPHETEMKKRKA